MPKENARFRATLEKKLIELTREYCQLLTDLRQSNLPNTNKLVGTVEDIAWSKLQIIGELFDQLAEYDDIMRCEIDIDIASEPDIMKNALKNHNFFDSHAVKFVHGDKSRSAKLLHFPAQVRGARGS
jgi:hypothetical protein